MKKLFYLSVACLSLAACTSESLVDPNASGTSGKEGPISFVMSRKNVTRSYKDMQETGHYNFGVFAYKSTDKDHEIMANYLVGYMDETNKKGYYMTEANQTTLGDNGGLFDGKSMWQYEGLGSSEYKYSGNDYYNSTTDKEYMSNVDKQYLRYWDMSAPNTHFIAYAPYINNADAAKRVQYVDGTAVGNSSDTYVLNFPNGVLTDGYDNEALSEYMWASTNVASGEYGHDVALQFKRLNAKVNIKFWEDIPGYSVRILDLGKNVEGVQAAPSIKKASDTDDSHTWGEYGYAKGKYYTANGAKIQFDANAKYQGEKQYQGTLNGASDVLKFAAPTAEKIGENRFAAATSPSTYYAIPKGGSANVMTGENYADETAPNADLAITGFTFHVTYELTSTTGERIVVRNATVHVPANYCDWKANTHYTYIFKITKNSNGTTTEEPSTSDIDPTDPEVPTVQGLYPIVFDNCTVVDWDEDYSEWEITDGTTRAYHDVQLTDPSTGDGKYSLVSGDIKVVVTDNDTHASHKIDYTKVTVRKQGASTDESWYTYNTGDDHGTISVPTDAAHGVYVVTYTCDTPAEAHATHPATWTETFVVGDAYEITTHQQKIGTYFDGSEAKLNISVKKNASALTIDPASVEIVYPANIATSEKAYVGLSADGKQVVVKNNAKPGIYKVIYKVDEGSVVKVDDYDFEVVDYRFTLSESEVVLNAASKTVTAIVPAGVSDGVITMTSMPAAITLSSNVFTIANTCAEGTYTVTYTVDGTSDNVAKTVYTQTFKVYNAYEVSLNKATISRDKDRKNDEAQGSDLIQISIKDNGAATTITSANKGKLSVVDANGTDATSHFTISDAGVLKVNKTAATGTYKVKYVGQSGDSRYTVYAPFVVQQ